MFQFLLGIRAVGLFAHGILVNTANWAQHGETVAVEIAQILIGSHEGTGTECRGKDILPHQPRTVTDVEHREHCGHEVNLRTECGDALRTHEAWRIDDGGDVIILYRDVDRPGTGSAMVGDNNKDGVAEPCLAAGCTQELADGIIGVFHAAITRFRIACHLDFACRISERAMIADGHDVHEERFAAAGIFVHHAQRLAESVFITSTPDIGEGHFIGREILAVYHLIAVAAKIFTHIVEITVAPIEELHRITLLFQNATHGMQTRVTRSFDDTFASTRRFTERQSLQSAHGAVAHGKEIVHHQAMVHQRIEIGRDAVAVAISLEIFTTQTFHGDEHDVLFLGWQTVGCRFLIANQLLIFFCALLLSQHRIKLVVLQFIASECEIEIETAVRLQFGGKKIVVSHALSVQREHIAATHQQCGIRQHRYQYRLQIPQSAEFDFRTPHQKPHAHTGYRHQCRNHRHHRIRLEDVANHLVGVDQIVYGNEIVTHAEFVPKEVFADAVEQQTEHIHKHSDIHQRAPPCRSDFRHKQPQRETHQFISEEGLCYLRRTAAILIEYRRQEPYIHDGRHKQCLYHPAPRPRIFAVAEAENDNKIRYQCEQGETHVVDRSQQEYLQPLHRRESHHSVRIQNQHDTQDKSHDDREDDKLVCEHAAWQQSYYC